MCSSKVCQSVLRSVSSLSLLLISRSVILAHPKWGNLEFLRDPANYGDIPSDLYYNQDVVINVWHTKKKETFTQSLVVISSAFNFFPLSSVFSFLTGSWRERVYLAVGLSSLSNPTFSNLT